MLQAHDCSIVASQQVVNSNIMARFSVIFALLLVCTGVFASVEYAHFEKWISERGIEVKNPDKAWSVWKENVEFVYRHNSLGLSYKLALNDFAHLTPKELTGEGLQVSPAVPHTSFQAVSDPLPPSIDWRKKGAVTPVKNQGQCGSASAFATVDSVASYSIIETGKLVMPSIDEYVDCCLNGSCNGGFFGVFGYQCIAKLGGLACDYIPNANRTCLSKEFEPCVMIDGGSQVMPAGDEKALAAALVKQPIAVAVDASHTSFQLYASGVYYEPACSSEKLDHAMLLAGYGTLDGEDYWLVKNSWGSSWGIDGYIMMARNKNNNCGIATTAIYPN